MPLALICYNHSMRRPGFLAGTSYWFGEVSRPKPSKNFIIGKLAEINSANNKNHTPLTDAERRGRLFDVLRGKKPTNITGNF